MRREMRESNARLREEMKKKVSERNERADILLDKWQENVEFGNSIESLREKDENKARNLAIILENQENHLSALTETQISSVFQTTPENVMRIIRLGYPNSIRGEVFLDWAMETAHDSIYYLHSVIGKSKRDGVKGSNIVESHDYRYASEIEIDSVGTGTGSESNFSGSTAVQNNRPYSVKVLVNGTPVASDDGNGNFISSNGVSGTFNYQTGAYDITFATAPESGAEIEIMYNADTEVASNYANIGDIELQLKDYQFRIKPRPLYISWTKMTELVLGTTLKIDAEEELMRGVAEEFKKSLDFDAVARAYAQIKNRTVIETFDCKGAVGEPEIDRMNAFTKAMDNAGDLIYNKLLRGGVSHLVCGTKACNQIKLHSRFTKTGEQPKIGVYRVGELDGVAIYKAPNFLIPQDEILTNYKNENVAGDVSIAFGTLVPLYMTQTTEFKEMFKELGCASFGDAKVLNPQYLQKIKLTNIA